jgi:hypothetical protein
MSQDTVFFDIETTGLTDQDKVTVMSTEHYESSTRKVFNFARTTTDEERTVLCRDLMLDFVTQWVLKTSDILEQMRLHDNADMTASGRWHELEQYCSE